MPGRVEGAALFADIVGFTALTAQLLAERGPRRGAEELAARIDSVYDALVAACESQRGSVVGFAGDALVCWFEGGRTGPEHADLAARDMQAAMAAFRGMALRIGIGAGPARRVVAGDPDIQLLDVLGGPAVARMAQAGSRAQPGEILSVGQDEPLAPARDDARYSEPAAPVPSRRAPADPFRRWLLPAVREAERSGRGAFLIELRPTVAVFVGFEGIDLGTDPQAASSLDTVVRHLQHVARRHEGVLLQLTFGDKGSYAYVSFGAPVAHEDDRLRAVRAAWQMREALKTCEFVSGIRIGVAAGVARTGAYGSRGRATYGALGDHVNVAAHLMSAALAGQILLAAGLRANALQEFELQAPVTVALKGHAQAESASAVSSPLTRRGLRLHEPWAGNPLVGRKEELARAHAALGAALLGKGQFIVVSGDAGIGKSRLVAEIVARAQARGFECLGGACSAPAATSPYFVWKPLLQSLFGLDDDASDLALADQLQMRLRELAPHRAAGLPILAQLITPTAQDDEFTRTLTPEDRANLLAATIEDTLRAAAVRRPLLVVLEDIQWIDPASRQLLDRIAARLVDVPMCLVCAARPAAPGSDAYPGHALRLALDILAPDDALALVLDRLGDAVPARDQALRLAEALNRRAEGNAFYLEELVNLVRERGLLDTDPGRWTAEMPESLHALVLARMDRLSESQRATLKAASVIGREFPARWLAGYWPSLGSAARVRRDLDVLHRLDITPLDTPQPLAYLFKHVITRDVAYDSLPLSLQVQLHEALAGFIEGQGRERPLDLLAFHYGASRNTNKMREYFALAGESAQARFANESALAHFDRLLPLLETPGERFDLHLRRARLLTHVARHAQADSAARAALDIARTRLGPSAIASAQRLLGESLMWQGRFDEALEALRDAQSRWEATDEPALCADALLQQALVHKYRADPAAGAQAARAALELARRAGDVDGEAGALSFVGWATYRMGDGDEGPRVTAQALELARASADVRREIGVLVDLGSMLVSLGRVEAAEGHLRRAIERCTEIGFERMHGMAAFSLANAFLAAARYAEARPLYQGCIASFSAGNSRLYLAGTLLNMGNLELGEGHLGAAEPLLRRAIETFQALGIADCVGKAQNSLAEVLLATDRPREARALIRAALAAHHGLGAAFACLSDLIVVAVWAATDSDARSRARDVVRLSSSTRGLSASLHYAPASHELQQADLALAQARTLLSEDDFQRAWDAGARTSLDEAVELGLGLTREDALEGASPAEA